MKAQKEDFQKVISQNVMKTLNLIWDNGIPNVSEYRLAREMIAYLEWEGFIEPVTASHWLDGLKDDFLQVTA